MITDRLEQCCHLLLPENYTDREVVGELLINSNKIKPKYIVPFRKELDKNILTRKSPEEKTDLVIYYVSELMKVQGILPDYSLLEFEVPDTFLNLKYSNHKGELTNLTHYKVNRHFLYALLFNEIQKACFNFKIPFLTICRELWFPLDVIDTEISKEYEKLLLGKLRSDTIIPTTFERLRSDLRQKGFYNLKSVKALPDPAREKLISILNDNELPYQVAMFDFLGFFDYFEKEYGLSKNITYKKIAEILAVAARSVRGNVLVLQDNSKEDRQRYTSYNYKDQVRNDYIMLK
jgi:hypothetical protein